MKWTGIWHCARTTTVYRCLHAVAWESLSPVDSVGAVAGELADGAQVLFRFYLKVDASGATKHLVLEDKEVVTGRPVGFDKLDQRILDATKRASDFIVAMHEEAEWKIGSSLVLRPQSEKALRALSPAVLTGGDAMDEVIKRVIDAAGVVATAPVEAPPPASVGVCAACNSQLTPGARFCIECGARQAAGAAAPKIDDARTTENIKTGFPLATLITEWARAGGNPSPEMKFPESGDVATYTFGINENGAIFRSSIEAHRDPEKAIFKVYLPNKVPEAYRALATKILGEAAPDGFLNLDADSGEVSWIGHRPVSKDNPLAFEEIDGLFNMAWEEAIKALTALQEAAKTDGLRIT
jgi:hypothetical protein